MQQTTGITADESRATELQLVFGELSRNWGWLLALGIVFLVLGAIGLGISAAVTVATVLLFGVLLCVGGVLQAINVFKCRGWKSTLLHLLIALLYILAGVMLVREPVAGSMVLTILLGGVFAATGILRITMAVQLARIGFAWGWMGFAGAASLVLGAMILFQWPASALWVIGLLIAIELIFHGWACVMMALALKAVRGTATP